VHSGRFGLQENDDRLQGPNCACNTNAGPPYDPHSSASDVQRMLTPHPLAE